MKPLTRKEMLLNAAANGTLDNFEPATREEVFTKEAFANAGGGVTSWNDLTDRPFGGESIGDTFVWDSIPTDDMVHIPYNEQLGGWYRLKKHVYKISDKVPTINDLSKGVYTSMMREGYDLVANGQMFDVTNEYGFIHFADDLIVIVNDAEKAGYPTGTYLAPAEKYVDGEFQPITHSITITDYEFGEITPLPSEYLPEGVSMDGHTHPFSEVTDLPEHLQFGEKVETLILADTDITDFAVDEEMGDNVLGSFVANEGIIEVGMTVHLQISGGCSFEGEVEVSSVGNVTGDMHFSALGGSDRILWSATANKYFIVIDGVSKMDDCHITMTCVKSTITPLDPKYLPVMTVNVTGINDDYTATMDKTYSEIREHIDNGGEVDCVFRVGTSATYHKLHVSGFNNSTLSFIGQGYSMTGVNELASFVHYILRIGDGFANWAEINMLA